MSGSDGPLARASTPTLRDVAKLAGVSIATASKALNNRNHVHPDTRTRVHDAARRISFTPNALAQGLSAGQSGTVGLITGDLTGRFSIPILMGAEDAFGAGKVSIFLCDARGDALREQYHLQALLGRSVDGLIVVGRTTNPRSSLGDLPVPVVYVYSPSEDPDDLSLVPNNIKAGVDAAEHMIKKGRTRIAHITGDENYAAATDRTLGITRTLGEHRLDLAGGSAMYGEWTEEWGRNATQRLIDEGSAFDSIICGSDQIARGALDTLRQSDHAVPGRVAVMGFDNWELFTSACQPTLTSVDMNLESLGRVAAQRLIEAIDGGSARGIETHSCRVVERLST